MPETWPSGLQQLLNEQGFGYQTGVTTIRSTTDIGPAKVRRTSTKPVDTLTSTINVTTAQAAILDNFYDLTLNGGARSFNFVHPLTGVLREMRFTEPPAYRSLGGGVFIAQLSWEVLP